MSSELQHKLYDLEATPPIAVWEKIAAELDEATHDHEFSSLLSTYEVAPPPTAWNKINAALDETLVADPYAAKLSGLEIEPPAAAWASISSRLDEKAIPEHRRISPLFRYAAAAAVIAAITFGALQLFKTKNNDGAVAKENIKPIQTSTQTTAEQNSNDKDINNTKEIASTASDDARNDAALEESKMTFAKLDVASQRNKLKNAANFYFTEAISSGSMSGMDNSAMQADFDSPDNADAASRYIVLMTPEGNIVRMSKKLGDLVCCVSGEDEDENCKGQMKKWRDKIATSCGAHSPGNFIDLLSLVNSLQDNN